MKKLILSYLLVVCTVVASATTQPWLELAPCFVNAGGSGTVLILLNNETTAISSLDFLLKLPNGVTADKNTDGKPAIILNNDRKGAGMTASAELQADGRIKVFVSSLLNSTFSGSQGCILTLKVQGNATLGSKLEEIKIEEAHLATPDGSGEISSEDVSATTFIGDMSRLKEVSEMKGHLTIEAAESFNSAFSTNNSITNVNLEGLTGIDDDVELQTGNPNTLYFTNSHTLSNSANVVCEGVCSLLRLQKGYPYTANKAFQARHAELILPASETGWQTVTMPFIAMEPEGIIVTNYQSFNERKDSVVFIAAHQLRGNSPYIIHSKEAVTLATDNVYVPVSSNHPHTRDCIGTFLGMDTGSIEGKYILDDDGQSLRRADVNTKVEPFGAYFDIDNTAEKLPVYLDDGLIHITLCADNAWITYGDEPSGNYNYKIVELPPAIEQIEWVTEPILSCEASNTSSAGEYSINITPGIAPGFAITYVPGVLTILKRRVSVYLDDPSGKEFRREYGEENQTFTIRWENNDFVNGEDFTVFDQQPIPICSATRTSPAGGYIVTVSDVKTTNYEIECWDRYFEITKAPLTITAKNYTINKGEAFPIYEATYEGFKNDETEAVLTTPPEIYTTVYSSYLTGEYDIYACCAETMNYDITYVNGKLTIKEPTYVAGDADGDGKVDVNDVTTTINYILKKPYSKFVLEAADVDGDKKIDVNDVQGIIDIALGKRK